MLSLLYSWPVAWLNAPSLRACEPESGTVQNAAFGVGSLSTNVSPCFSQHCHDPLRMYVHGFFVFFLPITANTVQNQAKPVLHIGDTRYDLWWPWKVTQRSGSFQQPVAWRWCILGTRSVLEPKLTIHIHDTRCDLQWPKRSHEGHAIFKRLFYGNGAY